MAFWPAAQPKWRSENRHRIYRRRRPALQYERKHREHELVTRAAPAGGAQRVEVGVVDKMHAHRHQHPDMDRKNQFVAITGRKHVAHSVAPQDRDSPLVEPWQATRIETRHPL